MRRHARRGSSSSTRSIRLPSTTACSELKSRPTQATSAPPIWTGSKLAVTGCLFSIICLTSSSRCRNFGCLGAVYGLGPFNLLGRHGCGDSLAVNPELLRSQGNVIAHKLNYMPDVAVLDLVQQQDVPLPLVEEDIGSGFQSANPPLDTVCQGATPYGRFQKLIRIGQQGIHLHVVGLAAHDDNRHVH